jgi:NTE family protein
VDHVDTKDLIDRAFHLALSGFVREKQDKCALFIEPPAMSRFGMFDIDDSDAIYVAGYEYVMSMADQIEDFQKNL